MQVSVVVSLWIIINENHGIYKIRSLSHKFVSEIRFLLHKDISRLKYWINYDNKLQLFLDKSINYRKNYEIIKLYLFNSSFFSGLVFM